jgi:hypothetical protein
MMAQATIDLTKNSVVVMGPCQTSTFVRNCEDTKLVLFVQQLRLRDCKNLTIMLFSQTEPIIESSSDITFISAQSYYYAEFYAQMKQAKLSLWNNKWTEVFDFSKKESASNFAVRPRLQSDFVTHFSEMQKIMSHLSQAEGKEINSLKEVGEEQLKAIEEIKLDFNDGEEQKMTFEDSERFTEHSALMRYGVVPTKTALKRNVFDVACLLIVAHSKFEEIYEPQMLAKLMIVCGSLLKHNEERKKMVSWIDESRTTQLTAE